MIVLWIGGWVGVVVSVLHAGHRSVGNEVDESHPGYEAVLQLLWPSQSLQDFEVTLEVPADLV